MNILTIPAGCNCYLLTVGEQHLLIDAGMAGQAAKIERILSQNGIAMEQIKALLLTHGHADHIGNAAIFQKKYAIPVVIHEKDVALIANPVAQEMKATHPIGRLIKGVGKWSARRNPAGTFTPDIVITAQETNRLGFGETIVPLPGHTRGSMVILFPGGECFVGDLLMNLTGPHAAYLYEDAAALKESVKAVEQLAVKTLYYGHGRPSRFGKVGY